ncbi:rpa-associated protein [Haloferax elongans ATCC BAA-1513]|uniref:Rpa-associated protein n=1 Tax=Haloferax elongans ATCC BAA-1513 TaxID=1230453 RepID=M0HN83_HALEO|nr:rpa-associated protein [Haloferax elongans]ELZ85966.1 rpa-associated protein [Haloferax elongans ATCC BAA-1513]
MSSSPVVGTREVAYRVFAAEFDDASLSYSESDEERAPNYVVTPTGARLNRTFVAGVLTEVEPVNDEVLRGRFADPTGVFVTYAGQYQPEAMAFLDQTKPPAFVALTGKARTYEPDDSDVVFTSIRPESVNDVDADVRDRWVVSAAEATLERIAVFDEALSMPYRGENLQTALEARGVDPTLAAGIPRAIDHYGTTRRYLEAMRTLAVQTLELVTGDRTEVDQLTVSPDEPGDVTLGTLPELDLEPADAVAIEESVEETDADHAPETDAAEEPAETPTESEPIAAEASVDSADSADSPGSDSTPSESELDLESDTSEPETEPEPESEPEPEIESEPEPEPELESEPEADPVSEPESESAIDSEPEPDIESESEPDIESEPGSEPSLDAEADAEPSLDTADDLGDFGDSTAESGELGDFDDTESGTLGDFDDGSESTDGELGDFGDEPDSTDDDTASTADATGATDAADPNGMYELDEEEREEIESEFGTEFTSGAEVDPAGEADIDVPDADELEAEAADEPAADTEPASDEPALDVESESEPEPEPEADAETEPAAESDPEPAAESDEPDVAAEDVNLEAVVVEAMEGLDDGDGAARDAVVDSVVDEYGVDAAAVDDAIEEALLGGRCYEPKEDVLKAI